MSDPEIRAISPYEVLDRWDDIEPLILSVYEAMPNSVDATIDEIVSEIQADMMQVWSINDLQAMAITMLKTAPERHLFVYMVAGEDVHAWFPQLMDRLELAGRSVGCQYVECCARPGWGRVARPLGYREQYRILRKEIV